MSTPQQLRELDKHTQAMLADEDLSGDLLLLGLRLARSVFLNESYLSSHITDQIFPKHPRRHWHIIEVMKSDIRRYEPEWSAPRPCGAPMVRRRGTCGKSPTLTFMEVDTTTGERYRTGGCSRHYEWARLRHAANLKAVKEAMIPSPPANTGGVLAKHLPQIDWPHLWKTLNPEWEEPAEAEPARKLTKADLRLIMTVDPEESNIPTPAMRLIRTETEKSGDQ